MSINGYDIVRVKYLVLMVEYKTRNALHCKKNLGYVSSD